MVAVICAVERGQKLFRIAAGGGEKSSMHESGMHEWGAKIGIKIREGKHLPLFYLSNPFVRVRSLCKD